MIDIESQVFSTISSVLKTKFTGITVESITNLSPASFPYVSIEESDNFAHYFSRTSTDNEHCVEVVYDVNVYANSTNKKQTCKKIFKEIDDKFNSLGFTRYSLEPIILNNGSILRYFGRYRAIVDKNNKIYRR